MLLKYKALYKIKIKQKFEFFIFFLFYLNEKKINKINDQFNGTSNIVFKFKIMI
jgi:hypothetical protein